MAAVVGLTVIKRFPYRADTTEEWSNQYHFTGAIPADDAAWTALFNALVVIEKPCYSSLAGVVQGYGYATDNEDDPSVWTHDIHSSPVAGTLATSGGQSLPGDAAVWARWKTSRLNTKGKAIYLRKYFHMATATTATTGDVILPAQKTALLALGAKLQDGTFIDGRTIRSMHHDETILSHSASDWVTTRTLKRRGKRPTG